MRLWTTVLRRQMIKPQYQELFSRSKEISISSFIDGNIRIIFDERKKREKLAPGEVRDWTPAKANSWSQVRQLEYIRQYKNLIINYKGVKELFEEEFEKRKIHVVSLPIKGKYATIDNCRIRFVSYLNNRKQIPNGVYFLWKKSKGYKLKGTHFRPENMERPYGDGFYSSIDFSRRTAWHKIARAVVHLNRIIWLERRTCWEDMFDWLN